MGEKVVKAGTKHLDVEIGLPLWLDLKDLAGYAHQPLAGLVRALLTDAAQAAKARLAAHENLFRRAGNGAITGAKRV